MDIVLIYFFASFFGFLYDIVLMYIAEHYYAKKCHYDCSKCKNWHCQYHECESKRNKIDK